MGPVGSEDWVCGFGNSTGIRLPGLVDWDEAAGLWDLLTLRARSARGYRRGGFTDRLRELIRQLRTGMAIRPNGVRRALEAMSAGWKGQPTLPGECSAGRLNQR